MPAQGPAFQWSGWRSSCSWVQSHRRTGNTPSPAFETYERDSPSGCNQTLLLEQWRCCRQERLEKSWNHRRFAAFASYCTEARMRSFLFLCCCRDNCGVCMIRIFNFSIKINSIYKIRTQFLWGQISFQKGLPPDPSLLTRPTICKSANLCWRTVRPAHSENRHNASLANKKN